MIPDLEAILGALVRARVQFIVIGGVAGTIHGSARATFDLDLVYQRSDENLQRLVAALGRHRPRLRGAPPDLPFRFDLDTLRRGLNFTLDTDLGPVDLFGEVVGGGAYGDLIADSRPFDLYGQPVHVVTLDKLITLKRAAGRPKDLDAISELEALREEYGTR